uniref:MARVEL domain-containing protein n=1 Tax=Pseudonaja textilis TaxID=8673 RepID=A0A670Z518_PSETE
MPTKFISTLWRSSRLGLGIYAKVFKHLYLTFPFFSLAQVFSLVIFASLVTEGYQNLTTSSQLHCIFNDNGAACCYGITVGVLSFLQCFLFLGCDVYDTCITNHKFNHLLSSVTWTCLWFIGFCILANQWNRSTHSYLLGTSAARASIAFAFLSVPCWVRPHSSTLSYNIIFLLESYPGHPFPAKIGSMA